jgi:ABC-type Fe3+-hydroxamate transport system substrate-binding protein
MDLSVAIAITMVSLPAAAIDVVDDGGHHVVLAKPARRIVSLSPHATEMLYAIEAGDRLVGRDGASDYPAAATRLPAVGQYGAFNLEAIIALKPDLVVAWEGPQAGPATTRLRALGISVFASQPGTVAAIPATLRALGELTGNTRHSEPIARDFEQGWQALLARYAYRRPLVVVPQVGDEPAMTVNKQQFVAAAMAACHIRNPFGEQAAAVPLLSPEALLAAKPDAIVAFAEPAMAKRWLHRWQPLGLRAAWLDAPADTLGRPGPRVLAAATTLCAKLDRLR